MLSAYSVHGEISWLFCFLQITTMPRQLRARKKPTRYVPGSATVDEDLNLVETNRDGASTDEEECKPSACRTPTKGKLPVRSRSNKRRKLGKKPKTNESSEEENYESAARTQDQDGQDDDTSEEEAPPITKRARRKGKSQCPHCLKYFSVNSRLNYHLRNFVCRPELKQQKGVTNGLVSEKVEESDGIDEGTSSSKDDESNIDTSESEKDEKPSKGRKRKRAPASHGKGKKSSRAGFICPTCKRTFTRYGLKYHLSEYLRSSRLYILFN